MKKFCLLILTLFMICGCTNKKMYDKTMFYMDTMIEVKLYGVDKKFATDVLTKVDSIYKEYHELTDRYNSYEGVVNLYYLNNELDNNKEIEISSKLSELINYGISMYDNTEGYINIAMGNVIDVWKKFREDGTSVPKTYELMDQNINIKNINLKDNMFMKTNDVKLDLGAYAKGYVTQKVAEYIESVGCTKYLINAGGNVKVGESYKVSKYSVGLEEPFNVSNVYKVLSLENVSAVTSGSYQRYYEVNGEIYNHIINPKTLFPDNYTKSVTVVTEDSAYADILSTYLFMLPIEDGLKYINSLEGVEAIWYVDNEEIYYSEGFNMYEQI